MIMRFRFMRRNILGRMLLKIKKQNNRGFTGSYTIFKN